MKKVVVVGSGGLAREFTQWFSSQIEIVGYLSNNIEEHEKFNLPGRLFEDERNIENIGTNLAVIAVGSPILKEKIYIKLTETGYQFPVMIHQSSLVAKNVNFAEGVVICPFCCVGSNTSFGALSYINFSCGIGHDTQMGEFIQINPGAQIGGSCNVEKKTLIGSGAVIRQGIKIGEESTIGSGSVVLNKVRAGTTVIGNPARRFKLFDKGYND